MTRVSFDNYTFAGDRSVIALCAVIILLLFTSCVSRTRSFFIVNIIGSLVAATAVNIRFHFLLMHGIAGQHGLIHAMRILCHALLFDVFFLFTLYDSSRVPGEKNAIELTESRSEAGFMIMKEKIEELSQFLPRAG